MNDDKKAVDYFGTPAPDKKLLMMVHRWTKSRAWFCRHRQKLPFPYQQPDYIMYLIVWRLFLTDMFLQSYLKEVCGGSRGATVLEVCSPTCERSVVGVGAQLFLRCAGLLVRGQWWGGAQLFLRCAGVHVTGMWWEWGYNCSWGVQPYLWEVSGGMRVQLFLRCAALPDRGQWWEWGRNCSWGVQAYMWEVCGGNGNATVLEVCSPTSERSVAEWGRNCSWGVQPYLWEVCGGMGVQLFSSCAVIALRCI